MPINNETTSQIVTNANLLEWVLESQKKQEVKDASSQDSIVQADSYLGLYSAQKSDEGVSLTPPSGSSSKDNYMDLLVTGLNSFVQIQANSLLSQTNEFANLQDLDQTMAKSVLDATNQAIDQEKNGLKLMQDLSKQQADSAWVSRLVSFATTAFIVTVILVTAVATVLTAGAASPLLAGEVAGELGTMGAEGAAAMGEGAAAATEVEVEATAEEMIEEEVVDATEQAAQKGMEVEVPEPSEPPSFSNTEMEKILNQDVKDPLGNSVDSGAKAPKSSLSKVGSFIRGKFYKGASSLGVSGAQSAPYFVNSWARFQVSAAQTQQAQMERAVGEASGTLNTFNGYLDFYQQSLQQVSGLIQQTAKDYGSTVSSIGAIFAGYDQISAALRQAAV